MGRHGGSHRWHVQDRSPHGAQGRGGLPQGAPSLQLGRRRHCAPWGRSSLPIAGVGKASRFTARWSASRCGDPFRCWTTGGRVYWRKKGPRAGATSPTRGRQNKAGYNRATRPATRPMRRTARAEAGASAPHGRTARTAGGRTGSGGTGTCERLHDDGDAQRRRAESRSGTEGREQRTERTHATPPREKRECARRTCGRVTNSHRRRASPSRCRSAGGASERRHVPRFSGAAKAGRSDQQAAVKGAPSGAADGPVPAEAGPACASAVE